MTRIGVPTTYRGVRFRSRLEARWAMVFSELDWRWEYEPIDLNGYIPDFILMFPAGPVLVEIKPEFSVPDLIASAADKIDKSGWTTSNGNGAVILGGAVTLDEDPWHPTAGALGQWWDGWDAEPAQRVWDEGAWFTCGRCRRPSIYHTSHTYFCTVCGEGGDGGHQTGGDGHLNSAPDLSFLWHAVGNQVQWNPA